MIAVVKCADINEPHQYYTLVRAKERLERYKFVVDRHGNARKSHAGAYYHKDASILYGVQKKLESGTSPDKVYIQMNKNLDQI